MMKVLVNGEAKELDYSRNGADCTNDFVEAAQYQYDDESGAYIMDSDTFDFWEEAIEKQEELDRLIAEYPQYESEFWKKLPENTLTLYLLQNPVLHGTPTESTALTIQPWQHLEDRPTVSIMNG